MGIKTTNKDLKKKPVKKETIKRKNEDSLTRRVTKFILKALFFFCSITIFVLLLNSSPYLYPLMGVQP
jgi:uncharacterized membrane protein